MQESEGKDDDGKKHGAVKAQDGRGRTQETEIYAR